jgi:ATP-dependent RNA helicase DDX24/MAK5
MKGSDYERRAAMKAELGEMLERPLITRGVSTRYITSGSRPIVDDLLAGERESLFFGGCVRV